MWRRRGFADERNRVRGWRTERRRRQHDSGAAAAEGIDMFQVTARFRQTAPMCHLAAAPLIRYATVKSATVVHSPTGPTRQSSTGPTRQSSTGPTRQSSTGPHSSEFHRPHSSESDRPHSSELTVNALTNGKRPVCPFVRVSSNEEGKSEKKLRTWA